VDTQQAPSASGIVYLFGDHFVDKARLGGESLLYGGAKVKQNDLANQLLVAAFVGLAKAGCLQMERFEKKRLGVFTERDVETTRSGEPKEPLYGLEAAIWGSITGKRDQDRVKRIVGSIIGSMCANPWGVVVARAKDGLLEQAYLATDKEVRRFAPDKIHWSANDELIAPHQGKVEEVKAMLSSFEAADPDLYKQLVDSVKGGIKAMHETPDYD
jgi:hypothetical protein